MRERPVLWTAGVYLRRLLLVCMLAGLVAEGVLSGLRSLIVVAAVAVATLILWRAAHRRSFRALVGRRLAALWRWLWIYGLQWRATTAMAGLGHRYRERLEIPRLVGLCCGAAADSVLVRLRPGQALEELERAAPALAQSFGARECRVRQARPGWCVLEFPRGDLLAGLVPALPVFEDVDLAAVAVGRREDGGAWTLRVLGSHLLVAGATGSGKGSVIWSLLRGLGPAIRDGQVAVWAVDPKGGMELGPGRGLFARLAERSFEEMADLLDDAVAVMQERARRLAGVTRLHEPTSAEPLILVVVDEVATLSAYLPDRKLRERIGGALALLVTQGRAVGVSVLAALQDPRKEVLAIRNLFPARVCLRLDEQGQVDMVLGDGARERGARCDRIPTSQPGVGYVALDGVREPVRVRASWVSDADIAETVRRYAPARADATGHAEDEAAAA
jgi:S-DNA-T family DNA segregation ATPase FtsK/SpoIIIE